MTAVGSLSFGLATARYCEREHSPRRTHDATSRLYQCPNTFIHLGLGSSGPPSHFDHSAQLPNRPVGRESPSGDERSNKKKHNAPH